MARTVLRWSSGIRETVAARTEQCSLARWLGSVRRNRSTLGEGRGRLVLLLSHLGDGCASLAAGGRTLLDARQAIVRKENVALSGIWPKNDGDDAVRDGRTGAVVDLVPVTDPI